VPERHLHALADLGHARQQGQTPAGGSTSIGASGAFVRSALNRLCAITMSPTQDGPTISTASASDRTESAAFTLLYSRYLKMVS
jgi:hypothetical protein